MFDLRLNENGVLHDDGNRCFGIITVGDFSDTFSSSLEYWKREDYNRSWITSVKTLFNTNFTVFFSDVGDPNRSSHFFGYAAFTLDEVVYFQHMIFLRDQYDFWQIIDQKYSKRPSLILVNEDGNRISTWACPVESIVEYFQRVR